MGLPRGMCIIGCSAPTKRARGSAVPFGRRCRATLSIDKGRTSGIGTRMSAPRCGASPDREVASAYDHRLGRGETIVSVIPTKPVPAKPSTAKPLASKSPPTKPFPGERQLPNVHEGPPVPDSKSELPQVIRRTEVVAIALVGLLIICIIAGLYLAKAFFLPITIAFIDA